MVLEFNDQFPSTFQTGFYNDPTTQFIYEIHKHMEKNHETILSLYAS